MTRAAEMLSSFGPLNEAVLGFHDGLHPSDRERCLERSPPRNGTGARKRMTEGSGVTARSYPMIFPAAFGLSRTMPATKAIATTATEANVMNVTTSFELWLTAMPTNAQMMTSS